MLFHEGEIPDFGSIQQKTENPNILYLIAEDIPKLNGMLTKTAAESYLPEGSRFGFHTGTLAFVVDHKTAGTGKIYAYHRGRDQWYEFSIRSDLGLFELMRNRHARILREIKEISGTPPLTFKSNGRPLKNYRIYGNTVNGVSVGNLITEGEHAGEYLVPITVRGKNLFNSVSNWNLPGSFSTDGSKFPGSILGNRRTYFLNVQPNTSYTISFISCGDRIGITEYNNVIQPENYTEDNKLSPNRIIQSIIRLTLGENYSISFSTSANAKIVGIYYSMDFLPSGVQIETGNTATEYEPFHYPINTNIYVSAPLASGQSLSQSDANTAIPTIKGTNVFNIDTSVPPSQVDISGVITDLNS